MTRDTWGFLALPHKNTAYFCGVRSRNIPMYRGRTFAPGDSSTMLGMTAWARGSFDRLRMTGRHVERSVAKSKHPLVQSDIGVPIERSGASFMG